jgi:hypothetical protein
MPRYGNRRDAEFGGGILETPMPGCSLERAQRMEI